MKKYSEYKNSSIDWIGEIPSHWKKGIIKRFCKVTDGSHFSPKTQEFGFPYVSVKDIGNNEIDLKHCKRISETDFEKLTQNGCQPNPGDILLTKDGTIGRAAIVPQNCERFVVLSSLGILKPYKILKSEFLYYYLISGINIDQMYSFIHGSALTRLTIDKINNLELVFPPITEEQTTIATYLDRKTAEIDELIADKKRLLELYEEEKTAIINQAVTKGLDPNVPMKDSGVEWLGEVPSHWEVSKIKYMVSKVGSGVTPSGGASVYQLNGIPLLRSQNVHFNGFRLDDVAYISDEIHDRMNNSKVLSGDVLINITGASIGRTYFVEDWLGEANVNQHVCILRPNQDINTKYLYLILRSNIGQEQIRREQTGSGREGLNFEALKNFIIPSIQTGEQETIVLYIEKACRFIDTKIVKTQKLIELLIEYRTALISEVVTGKIKVA